MANMSSRPTAFVADVALRLMPPQARRARGRLALAAALALLIELSVFAVIWFERNAAPAQQAEEIPVEVVVEPPPPSPTPTPTPSPELKSTENEKPATDAPRAGKSDHDDEHVAEKEKPAAAPPPSPVATASPKDEPAKAPPKPSVLAVLPKVFDSVPDVDFGGAAIRSPVTGGAAHSTYLSQLYGLIVPRLRVPAVAHAYGRRLTGVISFTVDGRGRLVARYVAEQSGSMELDEAAMQAVAAASREFPPPPHRAPVGVSFTYSVE